VHCAVECFGLLYLNPPYDTEAGKRVEMEFLKHSMKWLTPGGLLVFIIPETVFLNDRIRQWIGEHFENITVVRSHTDEYPDYYRQAILFGYKRQERVENGEIFCQPPYPHIETVTAKEYAVTVTAGPEVFQDNATITDEEITGNRSRVLEVIRTITGYTEKIETLSPVLPLRKGHLVSLITAGVLDGRIKTQDNGFLLIKGFSDRIEHKRTEEDREITTSTYSVGIRVIESTPQGGRWYDIR
jgi:16S rRNA G966 N2-methylase RsmD